jgi:alanyl-tRNA synthetase
VLRRIIRRAIRYGRRLGLSGPFLTQVSDAAIERFQDAYPELSVNHEFITRVVGLEEDRFAQTFERGIGILDDLIASISDGEGQDGGVAIVSGADVFTLYDTYGFPPELTAEIAREQGLEVDMEGFEKDMEAQRERARAAHTFQGAMEILPTYENLGVGAVDFQGYERLAQESVVTAILVDDAPVGHATQGRQVEVVLRETPFYPEGGGQMGDAGVIAGPNGRVRIEDTQAPIAGLIVHKGIVEEGDISLGETVDALVDPVRRLDTARNHSGTHLLHATLRQILGLHVRQAGSLVAPDRMRFDYSHVSPLSREELLDIQGLANRKVRDNLTVSTRQSTFTQAVQGGALAFFGDRYGDVVRVVEMAGDERFSVEVCGGTHVHATGQVGTLVVLGESSIGGGMRRIEAMTGRAAEELFVQQAATLQAISQKLQAPVHELEARLDAYMADTDTLRRRLADAERSGLRSEAETLLGRVRDVDGVNLVASATSAHNVEAMREMGDYLKQKLDSVFVALGAVINGSPVIVTMITPDLVDRGLHAGNIARDAAKLMGGGGGGRPETAQAGGRQPERLGAALDSVANLVRAGLGN